ncbi:LysM peptidoglycan-binding domain-containing protein [Clostridium sp. 19966]|uniref:LysM peptidoglycan-binding domain-containing protein n=1 Tax=Clostridium sp. 19966 TaxID=2768166 RepID=UPI0028E05CCD|nr:LysM peptidoglycan-binding domain-containing protein [Clostridium sp. 19966]MDT8719760.1 LysM peptidoglycan-binding domain-containing protein [Clostridium sp. 19966]
MKINNKLKALVFCAMFTVLGAKAAHAATNYTVVSGDTLYSIGKTFGTSYTNIMTYNKLTSTVIKPGQVISIPDRYYTVQKGNTLYQISKQYGITVDSLKAANNLTSNIIYPGQKLLVPYAAAASSSNAPSASVIPYTAEDLDLLARLIQSEAANQSYSAKVAVGAVVINRVQSGLFANTLKGVIYEKINGYYQFTPVKNGLINNAADSASRNAAYAALHGSDPTNGALFYFDDSVTNQWLLSKPVAYKDGNLIFTY